MNTVVRTWQQRRIRGIAGISALLRSAAFALLLGLSGASFGAEPEVLVAVDPSGEVFFVEVAIDAQISLKTAWEVLTDFDHMSGILNNLSSSSLVSRDGNTLIVRQEGIARYGFFSFPFQFLREIRLQPMTRILSRNLSGTVKRMESEVTLSQTERTQGLRIRYHAEIVPDSALARMFGTSFLRHEAEEQFQLLVAEMKRREEAARSTPPHPDQGTSG